MFQNESLVLKEPLKALRSLNRCNKHAITDLLEVEYSRRIKSNEETLGSHTFVSLHSFTSFLFIFSSLF